MNLEKISLMHNFRETLLAKCDVELDVIVTDVNIASQGLNLMFL